jgi:hypothetical protein
MLSWNALLAWLEQTLRVTADFAGHLLLLGELWLVIGILFLGLGRGMGLPHLFWHEDPRKQAVVGLMATLLASQLMFVSFLLVPRGSAAAGPSAALADVTVGDYLLHGWWALLLLLFVPLVLFLRGDVGVRPRLRWPLVVGAAVGGGVTALLVGLGDTLSVALSQPMCESMGPFLVQHHFLPAGHCNDQLHHHVLAVMYFLLALLIYSAGSARDSTWSSPAVGLCTLLSLLAAVLGGFSFWLGGLHVLIVLGLGALMLWRSGRDRYRPRVEALAPYYDAPVPLENQNQPAPGLLSLQESLSRWSSALPEASGKRPLILVCASGGGIRAAVWTTAILCELERRWPAFPYHVRLFTGASGGMVGAGAYVGTLSPPGPSQGPDALHGMTHEKLLSAVAQESLSAVTHAMVFRDLWTRFLRRDNARNRGEALEAALRANLPEAFGKTLGELRAGEREGWRPSLVYSPMLVEDGRRLLISNLDLDGLLQNTGPRLAGVEGLSSRSGLSLGRLLPDSLERLPLATAARLSASFPYVSPAAVLPTNPRRRVVDAGYWDNYGVSLASAFLDECMNEPALRQWLSRHVSGVLLVQIRDGVVSRSAEGTDFRRERKAPPGPMSRGLEGLSSPLEGILSAREAAMVFRNDEHVEAVSRRFDAMMGEGFFQTTTFSFRGNVSLSWYLTDREKKKLAKAAARAVEEQAEALEQWWAERTAVEAKAEQEVA